MKIEIGESLVLSWLRHTKKCQLVQMNWKPSVESWDLMNKSVIEQVMRESDDYFKHEHDYGIYKKNTSLSQLIKQAEIDVMGVSYAGGLRSIYAVDVAFHEYGLNYGSKDETIMKIVKKLLRTAMCVHGYFDCSEGDIIFASPKINYNIIESLDSCLIQVEKILRKNDLNFNIKLIANNSFNREILQPVLEATSSVADTSELFMRSIQMYQMFSESNNSNKSSMKVSVKNDDVLQSQTKIGEWVRKNLIQMFEENKISVEEVELMESIEYSKKTFGIQMPLLKKKLLLDEGKPLRYWAKPIINAYGSEYFMCSEWYEKRNKSYFEKWVGLKNQSTH
ncbi:hypothetical protein [Thiothrix winogradskyi]|uniref:HTH-type transcriptional regulator AraC-type N-terminal domain-containing protein n=1 Tax=Thiothrix winogradskyi TaxID=96472 RepID=A0ABY3ST51_9GAMM|nr:hypothetical protein [Thiothrix winogradskyi]UJS22615.1 hypothetical protein L2Y54_11730 [Thiothrix winogradskyi]